MPKTMLILIYLLTGQTFSLPRPTFLMSWRRRIGKEDESLFFTGCEDAGLEVEHLGSRVYCVKPRETTTNGDQIVNSEKLYLA